MSVFKSAKMTAKTRKTLEAASSLLQVKTVHLRKDRAAIDEMERMLENEGYEWIPAKQEWAKVTPPLAQMHMRHFVVMCLDAQADVILMLIQAGAEALGVTVVLSEKIDEQNEQGNLSHLLMEMTE